MAAVPTPADQPQATALWPIERWQGGQWSRAVDFLAEETPLALHYNGLPHAVMMVSPQDVEDFALGFSLSEGIVENAAEVLAVDLLHTAEGIEVHLRIPGERMAALTRRERNLSGRTGCGLCGVRTLEEALRRPATVDAALQVEGQALTRAVAALKPRQATNLLTGAMHAAGWANPGGELLAVREDVGRHNALDKLIGAKARDGFAEGFAVITSRASYEMVLKSATVGIALLVAVSAPTALAARLAGELGLTLAGFARGQGFVVYTHPQRILHLDP